MENNALAVLVAVILMGTMAISMIMSAGVSVNEDQRSQFQLSAPFPDHARSDFRTR